MKGDDKMGKKFDISMITKAKWVPFAVAIGAAVMAFADSLGEHKKEKDFQSLVERLSDLEEKFKNK